MSMILRILNIKVSHKRKADLEMKNVITLLVPVLLTLFGCAQKKQEKYEVMKPMLNGKTNLLRYNTMSPGRKEQNLHSQGNIGTAMSKVFINVWIAGRKFLAHKPSLKAAPAGQVFMNR